MHYVGPVGRHGDVHPPPGDAPPPARLLDREHELWELRNRLDAVRGGHGGVVLIEGPGGIGKTELLAAARDEARARGLAIASARGRELERELAFGVVRQLLEPTVRADDATDLFDGAASLAGSVFGLGVTERPGHTAERSFAALHGLHWLCANLADRSALLLAIDDAHWADVASLEFLAYLAPRVGELPVALVVVTRPGTGEPGEWAIEELRAEPTATVLRPPPLTAASIAEVVGTPAGEAPDARFLEACRETTEGNPFLLRELTNALHEQAIEPSAEAADRVRDLGPRSVARRLLARLRRLSPGAVDVARAIAVLGGEGQVRHVAALADLTLEKTSVLLDALAAADVIRDGRPPDFVHPIVRAAIRADIPAGERARLHAIAARMLADEDAPGERVASHLLATEPAADPATVERLISVAREALGRGAPRSSIAYLRRALLEPPPSQRRPALLAELGTAESLTGDDAAVGHLREALESSSDPALRRTAVAALARFLVLSGQPGRAARLFEHAPASGDAVDPVLEAAAVAAGFGDVEAAPRLDDRLGRLRELAERQPDPPPGVFAALAIADAQAGEPGDRVAALALRALSGDGARGLGWVMELVATFSALLFSERFDAAAGAVEEGLAISRARGSAVHVALCSSMRSCLALRRGAVEEAEADARAALDTAPRQAHGFYGLFAVATLVESLVERDRCAQADEELTRIGLPVRPTAVTYGALLYARGRLRLATHRPADALEDFLATGRHMLRAHCVAPTPGPWRSGAGLALLALGDNARASELLEEEVGLASALGAPRALGIALGRSALAETGAGRIELLERAATVLESSQAQLERARVLAELGAARRRARNRVAAREPLRLALDLAQRCGGTAVAERARTELLATGARPRSVALSGLEALTASERRVATLAARGLANREIAQELFVTRRTVETHLTHAFAKLGIESRTQLAAALDPSTE